MPELVGGSFRGYFLNLHFKYYPLSRFPSRNPLSHTPSPCFYEGALPPTNSCLQTRAFPYTGESSLHQDQGSLFPLMPNKAIFCCISIWSHVSLYVYSLVGGLVPGSSGVSVWLMVLFFLWGCRPNSAPSVIPLIPPLGSLFSV